MSAPEDDGARKRWIPLVFLDPRRRRLEAAIAEWSTASRATPDGPVYEGGKSWKSLAEGLIDRARREGHSGDLDVAWRCFVGAARLEIYGLHGTALVQRARSLREEAQGKLRGWRQTATVAALDGILTSNVPAARDEQWLKEARDTLVYATLLRDEHFANSYFKISYQRRVLILLMVLLLFEIGVIAAVWERGWVSGPGTDREAASSAAAGEAQGDALSPAAQEETDEESAPPAAARSHEPDPPRLLWGVILFGALGGTFSAIQATARSEGGKRIPELVSNQWITLLRAPLGAGGALAAYVLLAAGVLDFVRYTPAVVLAFAFAAGTSERLVVSAVNKLGGAKT